MGDQIDKKHIFYIMILLSTCIISFVFFACENNAEDCKDIGQIKFIDTATIEGQEYTLLMRQTGFQDKVQFLVLYPHNINLDSCGNPVGNETANEIIDYGPEGGQINQWPDKIEIKNKAIIIHYTKDEKKRKSLLDIPVVWIQAKS